MTLTGKGDNLYISIIPVALLIVLRDIFSIGIPDIGLLVVMAFIMYLLPYTKLVYFLFFLFPLTCGIPGYIIFFGYLLLLNKTKSLSQKQILPVVLIVILDFLDEGISLEGGTLTGILSFASFCGVFFFFLNDDKVPKYMIPNAIFFFGIGTVFTFAIIFYNLINQYNIYYILAGFARSGALGVEGNDTSIMKGHLAMNANTIAYYAICTISSIIVLFKDYPKKEALALILISVICGILTLSRTFILCLGLTFLGVIFTQFPKKRLRIIVTLSIITIVLLFLYGDKLLFLSEGMIGRSNDENMATAGGRTLLFEEYNIVWLSSIWYIIFGAGVVNHFPLLGCSNAMHSGLQQIWVCLGLIGLIIYSQQIFSFLYKYNCPKRLFYILPFLVTFLFDQSIQFLNPYPLMLPIMVSLLVYKEGWLIKNN